GVRPPERRANVTGENDVTKLGHDGRACTVRRALLANPVEADGAVGPAGREVRQRAVRAHSARLRRRSHHVAAVRRARVAVVAEVRDSRAAGALHADVPRRARIRCGRTRSAVRDVGLHAALVAHARRGRAGVGVGAVRRRAADADAADAGVAGGAQVAVLTRGAGGQGDVLAAQRGIAAVRGAGVLVVAVAWRTADADAVLALVAGGAEVLVAAAAAVGSRLARAETALGRVAVDGAGVVVVAVRRIARNADVALALLGAVALVAVAALEVGGAAAAALAGAAARDVAKAVGIAGDALARAGRVAVGGADVALLTHA